MRRILVPVILALVVAALAATAAFAVDDTTSFKPLLRLYTTPKTQNSLS
jgi:hypothetical protein